MNDRKALRARLRRTRRALTRRQQRDAARRLLHTFLTTPELRNARRLAVYAANDGELDPCLLVQWCWRHGREVFLPVLHPLRAGELLFLPWRPDSLLARNRFGIPEPISTTGPITPLWTLDAILTPLVGFDAQGRRLGMGGGFYDRTLARLHGRTLPHQPRLWGLAHDCQQVDALSSEAWDIPMEGVLTDGRAIRAE